ncbi:Wound-induced protein 1 [Apostasia shenzhenica]|uniref:Wound-induced protein 1 n=1 Tax=Apostasia shenzhenica TaxID=1088818 RepID=A0A2I0BH42_9ASPA|nr:Wound-induced protein 1 [Apostasia shenzhenica]
MKAVLRLYEALELRDAERVQRLFAGDLEWWFHGPPSHQHMKRLLTGEDDDFHFLIHSVEAFGAATVVAEGTDPTGSVLWVHAWTVADGLITHVREYFNSSVTITRVASGNASAASGKSSSASGDARCFAVWKSRLAGSAGKSLPGLVLAI